MHKIVRLIVASGEQCADLRYAAGFSTPDEFIYFDDGTRRGSRHVGAPNTAARSTRLRGTSRCTPRPSSAGTGLRF